ncbi:hypothetical protein FRC09_001304 [Ceratobasidium sp. 395]|nr:hypothetical protein FRC09_001304 [Ceratobasidium sp. 395]
MNDRVLPSLGYTPRELLTGVLSADRKAEVGARLRQQYSIGQSPKEQVDINMALTYALRCDGAERARQHASERKRRFDNDARLLTAEVGDLVQRYDPRWDNTHSNERKLAPRWSEPLRVRERKNASYVLEDLHGNLVSHGTHARHLRKYLIAPGSGAASPANGERAKFVSESETAKAMELHGDLGEDGEDTKDGVLVEELDDALSSLTTLFS